MSLYVYPQKEKFTPQHFIQIVGQENIIELVEDGLFVTHVNLKADGLQRLDNYREQQKRRLQSRSRKHSR